MVNPFYWLLIIKRITWSNKSRHQNKENKLLRNIFTYQSWFVFKKRSHTCILKNIADRSDIVHCIAGKHFTSVITGSSHRKYSIKKGVLKNFASVQAPSTTLLKRRLWHRCFPVNFAKFLRTTFQQNISGWLFLDNCSTQIRCHARLEQF